MEGVRCDFVECVKPTDCNEERTKQQWWIPAHGEESEL